MYLHGWIYFSVETIQYNPLIASVIYMVEIASKGFIQERSSSNEKFGLSNKEEINKPEWAETIQKKSGNISVIFHHKIGIISLSW